MSEVSVKFTAEDAQLWAAVQKAIGGAGKLKEKNDEVGKSGRNAAREIERFGDATKKVIATPLEKYERTTVKLDQAVKAHRLTEDERRRALALAKDQMDKATAATDVAGQELRKFVAETKRLTATPLENYQAAVVKLDTAIKAKLITEKEHARAIALERVELERAQQAAARKVATGRSAIDIGGKLIGTLSGLAASYVSVQSAISAANQVFENNVRLQKEAYEAHTKLATAQQEAAANLTGMTPGQKKEVLEVKVRDIQSRTGFPSQEALTEAIGKGQSASGDEAATLSAVEAAAKLTPHKPEKLGILTAGALNVGTASGITDAEKNLGFLYQAGANSQIDDIGNLAKNLAPLVLSGIATVPGQDKGEAAREIAAVFGSLTRAASDKTGESTATAEQQLLSKMDVFFRTRPELDPGTVGGRLEVFQQDKKLRRELLGEEGFGSEKTKKAIEQLLTGGSALSSQIKPMAANITFDSATYKQAVQNELAGLTAPLRLSMEKARQEAIRQQSQLRESAGVGGFAREEGQKVLGDTMRSGPRGWLDYIDHKLDNFTDVIMGSSEEDSASEMRLRARKQRDALIADAFPAARESLTLAEQAESDPELSRRIREAPETLKNGMKGFDPKDIERAQKQRELSSRLRLTDEDIAAVPGPQKVRDDLKKLQGFIDSVDRLVSHKFTEDQSAKSPAPPAAAAPKVDNAQQLASERKTLLLDRREKLLQEAFSVTGDSGEDAIDFAKQLHNDPDLKKKLREEGGLDRMLRDRNIEPRLFERAQKFVDVQAKPDLTEKDVAALPATEETRKLLLLTQTELLKIARTVTPKQVEPPPTAPKAALTPNPLPPLKQPVGNNGPAQSGIIREPEGELFWSGIDPTTIQTPAPEKLKPQPLSPKLQALADKLDPNAFQQGVGGQIPDSSKEALVQGLKERGGTLPDIPEQSQRPVSIEPLMHWDYGLKNDRRMREIPRPTMPFRTSIMQQPSPQAPPVVEPHLSERGAGDHVRVDLEGADKFDKAVDRFAEQLEQLAVALSSLSNAAAPRAYTDVDFTARGRREMAAAG